VEGILNLFLFCAAINGSTRGAQASYYGMF